MPLNQGLVFLLIFSMLLMFIWGKYRYDLVALSALLISVMIGVVSTEDAFSGFSLMGYDVYNKKKLTRLKESMVNSEGTDVRIIPALGIKIGSYVTARVECHIYSGGVYKTVKSGVY